MFALFRRAKSARSSLLEERTRSTAFVPYKPRLEALEDRNQPAAVFIENFDNPLPPDGRVLYASDSIYSALSGPETGGNNVGNTFLNGIIDRSYPGAINSDQSGSGFFLHDRTGGGGGPFTGQVWGTITPVVVAANTTYTFSFYLTNENTINTAIIQPTVNGLPVGPAVSADGTFLTSGWQKFTVEWDSGTATTANLSLVNLRPGGEGNDFGIDAITLEGDMSDIAMQSAQLVNGNTVQFTYQTTGNPGPFDVGLYRSADGITYNPADQIGVTTETPSPNDGQATGAITITGQFDPDPTKPYLVVLADPPSAGNDKGNVIESNDTDPATNSNGNNATPITLPDLAPTLHNPDSAAPDLLHKLIYRGQTLSVPLFVKNLAGAATGDVTVEYYLSTNQNPDLTGLNTLLIPVISRTVSVPAGGEVNVTESVFIPTDLAKGSYWLKAKIIPTDAGQDNKLDNNIAVSDPLTVCSDTNSMTGGRAVHYESAVNAAKASPRIAIYTPINLFNDSVVKVYIQGNEGGLRADPYLDQRGIPTIGYGYALQVPKTDKNGNFIFRNGKLVLEDRKEAKERIKAANLVDQNGKKLTYNDVLELAKLGSVTQIGVRILPKAVADQWFDADYDTAKNGVINSLGTSVFSSLSDQARQALIDMAYNIGPDFLNGFSGMKSDLITGDIACAGFELMDSLYADELPGRSTKNFLLLVSGFEDHL